MSSPLPTVAFHTLGCKLNYAETATLARVLEAEGYAKTEFHQPADYYVINTCSVTENADKETRQIVKRALKANPEAKVIIIGCYAQLKPEEVASIPGVRLVLGAKEKFNLHVHLRSIEQQESVVTKADNIESVNFFSAAWSRGERTRSFLKVQDGCDYFCSFCTIPLARGASRSACIAETVAQAQQAAQGGVAEIVLTGVNIGDFGKTPDGKKRTEENFLALIQALDSQVDVPRFRISSIEPNLLTNDIISFVAGSSKFMPHFHIPLQSGSNRILKLMRRRYLRELYADRVSTILQQIPDCCIGADVIVGFPGESDEDFMETFHFLEKLDIAYLHVFTYSERLNTRAAEMTNSVPMAVRKERNRMLRNLSEKKRIAFASRFLGTRRPVLWENENHDGEMYGYTDNYIKVKQPFLESLCGTIQPVELSVNNVLF
ncbi:MAG: tRNA (N(6)-L-threonylcarbamoyladenosine(37)-C(2))-methylthiotransferase MtaB [Chitinophagales bacterium]|nr:tRNA (N(6)-L-threonylcarbamoyladenosine(37)-C(2))-methylthiotransferase MtaB [Chitinophagales bacterium]MDW8272956.1 tRNA (N(6)-L-threonylcarbamoyladenosine(37)-C(2))-methylthiotransferase MtaB [Chitinophagales bacterium]